tara:strand:+ start:231824 stop:232120 length:297 start_codon:yes stop_codon:yes gene_type:complete
VAAYVIFIYLQVFDEQRILEYRQQAHPTVAAYGGRVIVRPAALQVMEGPEAEYMIVTAWDDMAAAQAWYNSPEYQRARKLREGAAQVQVIITAGAAPD